MPKPLRLAIFLLLAAAFAYLVYATTHTARFTVEVCVSYQGQSACRTAQGRTRNDALRAAHDNACAQIVSGVTATLGCENTPATSVRDIE